MAEWLVEAGIGETRAALVHDDVILEAAIELDGTAPRPGDILPARLIRQQVAGRRGIVALADGTEALLEPLPAGLSEGGDINLARITVAAGLLSDLAHDLPR